MPTSAHDRLNLVLFIFFFSMWRLSMAVAGNAGDVPSVSSIDAWYAENLDDLDTLYRHFHRHPELSFQEAETATRLAKELRAVGAEVTTDVGGHGVVALLRNGGGPTLMLRTDLDGLPVREQTNLVYASEAKALGTAGNEVGVMHACGHDIHMTNLVGVARFLSSHRESWQGTVMFVGQPAEEQGAGAKMMLADGLFRRFPRPDMALALHVDADLETGKISYLAGFQQANVDSVDIIVKGRGGHGAYPHMTLDPIVQAAQLVLALQTIVSREIQPTEPAVVTVGSIHGGTTHNVIDNSCHLQITVRSYSADVRDQLHEAIQRKAKGIAIASGAPEPEVSISEGTPSLWNDKDLSARLLPVFRDELGSGQVLDAEPSMGGEDFSRYGKEGVPILMFRLGTVDERRLARYQQLGQKPPSLHSQLYYPDARESLRTGVRAMSAAALHLLKKE